MLVTPITEAARAAEVLLGPYTSEEHVRCRVVVREPRLNRAYDASVHLSERADPDTGKKKRAHVPEVEVTGPIATAPLCVARPRDGGVPSRSLEDFEERPAKRLAEGTLEWVECSVSSSLSSNDRAASHAASRAASPVGGAEAKVAGRTMSQVVKAIGTIGFTRLAAESSSTDTPSHVYGEGAEVLGEVLATPGLAIGKHFVILLSGISKHF